MSLLSQTSEITIISKLSDTLRGLNLVVAFGTILITTEWHLSVIEQRRYAYLRVSSKKTCYALNEYVQLIISYRN